METTPISGKEIAKNLRAALRKEIITWKSAGNRPPGLAAVLVGDYPPSHVYVAAKQKACDEIGMASRLWHLNENASQFDLHVTLENLNADPEVDGILLQLPLPKHLDPNQAMQAISSDKDVDGLHPISLGRLIAGQPGFHPCTPAGVMHLLHEIRCPTVGKRALVLGRSAIVGKPMALLLAAKGVDATVTIAHSQTQELPTLCKQSDLVVAAIGMPEFVKGSWIKPGAVVIDVGINRQPDGRIVGDVAYHECLGIASAITPVPGGVGPMTIAMLLKNTWTSAQKRG